MVRRGYELVYGGSHVGLMGLIADTVMAGGGRVHGVIPRDMADREIAHTGLTKLHLVGSMHERKAMMADLSDAFVALPGAYGTLDELCEILTWRQLSIHSKPIGLINVNGYWDPFLKMLDLAAAQGFLKPTNRALLHSSDSASGFFEYLASAQS